jgi:hypothetical protein
VRVTPLEVAVPLIALKPSQIGTLVGSTVKNVDAVALTTTGTPGPGVAGF